MPTYSTPTGPAIGHPGNIDTNDMPAGGYYPFNPSTEPWIEWYRTYPGSYFDDPVNERSIEDVLRDAEQLLSA